MDLVPTPERDKNGCAEEKVRSVKRFMRVVDAIDVNDGIVLGYNYWKVAIQSQSCTMDVKKVPRIYPVKLYFQITLLIWKRYCETTKSKWDVAKVLLPAIMFFILMLLIYGVISGLFHGGALEPFIVPLAFWTFIQRIVIQIMYEKSCHAQCDTVLFFRVCKSRCVSWAYQMLRTG